MNKKILIIDDDRINTAMLNSLLVKNDYEVSVAYDGEQGLELVHQEKPDLIILDVEMPNMNGYTFINELKKDEELGQTPVVVLTAHENMEPIFKTKGIKNYFTKPVEAIIFLNKLNELLG